ncbi:hypothetical protein [Clostridium botulinum]|uniref:hypothetical protein n=1 Tax=Clostridium botulinum TaxID=1491 RepID=UPI001E29980D|nr:hypothetical protein [Clostridium botulinum]MCD3223787.1 hypothetical protein [Clostridium botulinum C/D]MCD3295313.1 hypothetical protein [Clostridium botulinum C/D]
MYYKELRDLFFDNNIEAHAPYQKVDKCLREYVVIKDNGQAPTMDGNVNGWSSIQFFCYIPKDQYSKIEEFPEKIKELIKQIENIKYTGNETPVMFIDNVQAYLKVIEYVVPHQLKGRR